MPELRAWRWWGLGVVALVAWLILDATLAAWLPLWAPFLRGGLQVAEPRTLSQLVQLSPDGQALQVLHAHYPRVGALPTVRPSMVLPGLALWWSMLALWPALPWRRRMAELSAGTALLLLLGVVALVARVHYQYATVDDPALQAWFGGWRGWTAYFLDRYLVDIGFWVLPVAAFVALRASSGTARPD